MAAKRRTRKAKSRGGALELVPDAWERFEKFMKSIVSRPAVNATKSKTKAKSRKQKKNRARKGKLKRTR
jgi:hypothetical protein